MRRNYIHHTVRFVFILILALLAQRGVQSHAATVDIGDETKSFTNLVTDDINFTAETGVAKITMIRSDNPTFANTWTSAQAGYGTIQLLTGAKDSAV